MTEESANQQESSAPFSAEATNMSSQEVEEQKIPDDAASVTQGEQNQDEVDMGVQPQATDALPPRPNVTSTQENAVGTQYAQQALLSPLSQWLLTFGDSRVKRKLREPIQTLPDETPTNEEAPKRQRRGSYRFGQKTFELLPPALTLELAPLGTQVPPQDPPQAAQPFHMGDVMENAFTRGRSPNAGRAAALSGPTRKKKQGTARVRAAKPTAGPVQSIVEMTAVLRAQKANLQPATASGAGASEEVMDSDLLQLAMESLSEPHSPHVPQLALEVDEIPVPSSQKRKNSQMKNKASPVTSCSQSSKHLPAVVSSHPVVSLLSDDSLTSSSKAASLKTGEEEGVSMTARSTSPVSALASEAEVGSRSPSVNPVAEAAETAQNHTELQSPCWPTIDGIRKTYGAAPPKVHEAESMSRFPNFISLPEAAETALADTGLEQHSPAVQRQTDSAMLAVLDRYQKHVTSSNARKEGQGSQLQKALEEAAMLKSQLQTVLEESAIVKAQLANSNTVQDRQAGELQTVLADLDTSKMKLADSRDNQQRQALELQRAYEVIADAERVGIARQAQLKAKDAELEAAENKQRETQAVCDQQFAELQSRVAEMKAVHQQRVTELETGAADAQKSAAVANTVAANNRACASRYAKSAQQLQQDLQSKNAELVTAHSLFAEEALALQQSLAKSERTAAGLQARLARANSVTAGLQRSLDVANTAEATLMVCLKKAEREKDAVRAVLSKRIAQLAEEVASLRRQEQAAAGGGVPQAAAGGGVPRAGVNRQPLAEKALASNNTDAGSGKQGGGDKEGGVGKGLGSKAGKGKRGRPASNDIPSASGPSKKRRAEMSSAAADPFPHPNESTPIAGRTRARKPKDDKVGQENCTSAI